MNKKQLSIKEIDTLKNIRNWIAHKNHTPSIRELMAVLGYKSPRSVQDILEQLQSKGIIEKLKPRGYKILVDLDLGPSNANTINVPLLGTAACGKPIFAEENIESYIPVSTILAKPGYKYYLLHARGDSMNMAKIKDGDVVLVRQQPTADDGDRVVALIDGEATIKEFHRSSEAIVLKPKSTNPKHKPIILTEDFQIQGVVVSVIPNLNKE